ncbi:larval cuticle protein A3A-like [Macrobrachium nipponense]|uniref:larval cuticle protein A3A-like n=1 Tax=Macrobrachium nipponense TaxID=159736 RepID=UPI0030C877A1
MKVAVLMCLLGVALCAPQLPLDSDEVESVEPYDFGFVVEDDENTVYSNRQETQDVQGVVQGEYSWVAANGIRYITSYTADAANGFNAVTREEQTGIEIKLPEPYDSDERA